MFQIPSGQFHRIYTVSNHPSCYMYTFINKTLESLKTTEQSNAAGKFIDISVYLSKYGCSYVCFSNACVYVYIAG